METQLRLLDTPKDWRLDEHTRAVGRRGIQAARAELVKPHVADEGEGGHGQHRAA